MTHLKTILFCASVGLLMTGSERSFAATEETATRTIEDGGTGEYKAIMASDSSLETHTIFRPADLSAFGDEDKLPVVAWGNGACANSPWEHLNFLSEVASHGFLVVAIGPMPAEGQRGGGGRGGRGGEAGGPSGGTLTGAIDWAVAQNADEDSQYHDKIDITKVAVAGMSCGGLQALEAGDDPRAATTMVMNSGILPGNGRGGMGGMPALTKDHLEKIKTPMIYVLGGESDIAYANGMDDFERIKHVPVFVGNLDVGHGGTYMQPHGGDYAIVATNWLEWQLKGDEEAAKMFTGDPGGVAEMEGWKVQKKMIP